MSALGAADARGAMDRMYRRQRHIYDLTRKYYLLGRDELIDGLAPSSGGAVLEIACGTGRNLICAARKYGDAQFFGLDVSEEMLTTARERVAAAGLAGRISLARADATDFDPRALFGVEAFDRVFISYALSMIPPWERVVEAGLTRLAPGGSLHIVDFGDLGGLPVLFRKGLGAWLARFSVTPRLRLESELREQAEQRRLTVDFRPLYRRYAYLAILRVGA